jgi:hypothetical protein
VLERIEMEAHNEEWWVKNEDLNKTVTELQDQQT